MTSFFSDFAGKVAGHFSDCEFQLGMLFVVIVFLVALFAVVAVRRRNRLRREIVVSEEGGNLVISRKAFCDFVRGVVSEFPLLKLVDAWFEPSGDGMFRVKLKLKSDAAAELTALHEALRGRLNGEFKARLGIADKINAIDMAIVALPAAGAAASDAAEAASTEA